MEIIKLLRVLDLLVLRSVQPWVQFGVLACGKVKLMLGISDSEELLVLVSAVSKLLKKPTMSLSLPKVEITLIDGAAHDLFSSLRDFRSRDLSELSALLIEGSIKLSG